MTNNGRLYAIRDTIDGLRAPGGNGSSLAEAAWAIREVVRLVELVEELDKSLSNDGELPLQWAGRAKST